MLCDHNVEDDDEEEGDPEGASLQPSLSKWHAFRSCDSRVFSATTLLATVDFDWGRP